MYLIVTSNSTVIALHDRLYKKKNAHIISSSTLDEKWFDGYYYSDYDSINLNVQNKGKL